MDSDQLSPEHRRSLEKASAISPEVIAARGYRTITDEKELKALGFSPAQRRVPGLLMPIHAPDGTPGGFQYRPDLPRKDKRGRAVKYETPRGAGIRIDCPPLCLSQLGDPSLPVVITEGIKKDDSLASRGVLTLGSIGVWGFKGRNPYGGVKTSADLDAIAWNNRTVTFAFDSDVATNQHVSRARERFAEHLRRRGARVRYINLPQGPDGKKTGVDDFFAAGHSVEELMALASTPGAERQLVVASDGPALVLEQLCDAPVTEGARVPDPYLLKPHGLYMTATRVDRDTGEQYEDEALLTPAPIVVAGRYKDIDTSEYDLELSWRIAGRWQRTTLPRDIAADHRKLPGIALKGLPVTSLNAKGITDYIARYESLNLDVIPGGIVTRRCGWREVDGEMGFVLGGQVLGVDTVKALRTGAPSEDLMGEGALRLLADNAGTAGLAAALRSEGAYDGWVQAIQDIATLPRVLLSIYASLTPPLLHVLAAPDFIVDLCGETSIGKTATQYGGASVWGYPPGYRGGLVVAWNSTMVFAERYAELLNDLPLFLEDSQTADPRTLARTVYMLANGVGRGRGSPRGLRGVTRWRGVTISSGERPLSSVTQDGGARARIITLWGSPFGTGQGPLVRRFKAAVSQHYGHAGPRFVTWLLEHRSQWPEFRKVYVDLTDVLAKEFPGNVGDRYASYFAAMLVAGALATPVLQLPGDPGATVRTVMRELVEPQDEADTPGRALVDLIGWASANKGSFEGQEERDRAPSTYHGRWNQGQYIAIYPYLARAQLSRMGYSPDAVLHSWKERGWIKTEDDRFTCKVRVRGFPQSMITLQWSAVEGATAPSAVGVSP